jgi:SWIM zinc finger
MPPVVKQFTECNFIMAQLTGNHQIDQFIRTNADTNALTKGKAAFKAGWFLLKGLNRQSPGEATYSVRAEVGSQRYTVTLYGFAGGELESTCSCPYNWGDMCKHEVAAWLALSSISDFDKIATPPEPLRMGDAPAQLPDLTDETLKRNTPAQTWKSRALISLVTVISARQQTAKVIVTFKKETFQIQIARTAPGQYQTQCSCDAVQAEPLCAHKLAALLLIRKQFGPKAFDQFDRDWDAEKNALLADYGFSMADDLTKKFDFKTDRNGNLTLTLLDPGIQKVNRDWSKVIRRWADPVVDRGAGAAVCP